MIFTKPPGLPPIFTQAMLDAINVYGYLKAHTIQELVNGYSCNVHEFGVSDQILKLAIHLNYVEAVNISSVTFFSFLDFIKQDLLEEPTEYNEFEKGVYLVYLVLAERGQFLYEAIGTGEARSSFDQLMQLLGEIAKTHDMEFA